MDGVIEVKVNEALADDVGKGLARLNPEYNIAGGATLGYVIAITG